MKATLCGTYPIPLPFKQSLRLLYDLVISVRLGDIFREVGRVCVDLAQVSELLFVY